MDKLTDLVSIIILHIYGSMGGKINVINKIGLQSQVQILGEGENVLNSNTLFLTDVHSKCINST